MLFENATILFKMNFAINFLAENGASLVSDVITVVLLALLTVLSFGALIVFLCKYVDGGEVARKKTVLAVILAVGFAVRIIFALVIRGYREDYAVITDMIEHLRLNGVGGYYGGDSSVTLYPIAYFIYLIFGGFAFVTGISDFELGLQFFVKLPLILCDLASAYIVYRAGSKYFNRRVGYALCAFVCVSPVFFIASSVWVTPLVITAMFSLYACYFLARKKYAPAITLATLAAFTSKEGIYLFPVFAVFGIFNMVKAVKNIKRDNPSGKALLSVDYNAIYTVPAAFILSVAGAYLIGLTMFADYSYNIFKFIFEFTLKPFVGWKFFTYNGLSVYAIFGLNGTEMSARFPSGVIAGVIIAIVTAAVCVVYFSRKNRATLVMLAAYTMFTMQVYFPGSSAIGMQISLLLLAMTYALVKDKRILSVLFVTGLCFVINSGAVLANAGQLNNLADYTLTAETTLLTGGASAVAIACSVLVVLMHVYFTMITVNVGMTGQIKALGSAVGIRESLLEFFSYRKAE